MYFDLRDLHATYIQSLIAPPGFLVLPLSSSISCRRRSQPPSESSTKLSTPLQQLPLRPIPTIHSTPPFPAKATSRSRAPPLLSTKLVSEQENVFAEVHPPHLAPIISKTHPSYPSLAAYRPKQREPRSHRQTSHHGRKRHSSRDSRHSAA